MPLGKDRAITTKGARGIFLKDFVTRRRRLVYTKLCMVKPSYVENDFARAIGTVPQMEEVIDSVSLPPISDFRDYSWDWTNRLFKATVQLERSLLDFDQTGQTRTLIDSLAARASNFPDALLFTRLVNDSLYSGEKDSSGNQIKLFATTHLPPIGSTTNQSNVVTGTTPSDFCAAADSVEVATQILSDYRLAKARMRRFLDDNGQPWHNDDLPNEDFVIVCSPLLEIPMKQAFFSTQMAASDNVLKGAVRDVITSNYLNALSTSDAAADWYLFNVGTINRAIVYSSFRRIRDEQIEDIFEKGQDEFEDAGISLDDLKEFSSIRIETNLAKQGLNAEADVMLNDRVMMQARWRGEIFGGEWRNAVSVTNGAT